MNQLKIGDRVLIIWAAEWCKEIIGKEASVLSNPYKSKKILDECDRCGCAYEVELRIISNGRQGSHCINEIMKISPDENQFTNEKQSIKSIPGLKVEA